MKHVVAFLYLGLATAIRAPRHSRLPMEAQQVVLEAEQLLQNMEAHLRRSAATDDGIFASLDGWCRDSQSDKLQAVEAAQVRSSRISSAVHDLDSEAERLHQALVSARQHAQQLKEALGDSAAVVSRQEEDCREEELELQQLLQAVAVLSQPRSAPKDYRVALQELKDSAIVQMGELQSLLQETEGMSTSRRAGNLVGHVLQSNQLLGTLQSLMAALQTNLAAVRQRREHVLQEHKLLDAEADTSVRHLARLEQEDSNLRQKRQLALEELEDIQTQLETDQTMLANLRQLCDETRAGYQVRVGSRLEERQVVEATSALLASLVGGTRNNHGVATDPHVAAQETSGSTATSPTTLTQVEGEDAKDRIQLDEVELRNWCTETLRTGGASTEDFRTQLRQEDPPRVLSRALTQLQAVYAAPLQQLENQHIWLPGLQSAHGPAAVVESAEVLARFGRYSKNPLGKHALELVQKAIALLPIDTDNHFEDAVDCSLLLQRAEQHEGTGSVGAPRRQHAEALAGI